ncbi:hypothetical protein KEM60_01967 [Austwickia sp. TVS 96-490-7B]|uniref:dienelactone hydrolase family protein n=1 Tax=Austwickia sp. TVS 96-490-7B TaxID=2830843 RepID=UPI001C5A3EA1|nr:dienelactone hydrolase family protein [Austwickia sp. TVS 96-490-7B]MBW3085759.1 hypothetical protein [Austwickia sp. TVS 96-490-7B]
MPAHPSTPVHRGEETVFDSETPSPSPHHRAGRHCHPTKALLGAVALALTMAMAPPAVTAAQATPIAQAAASPVAPAHTTRVPGASGTQALRVDGPYAYESLAVAARKTPKGMAEAEFVWPDDDSGRPRPAVVMIAGWSSEMTSLRWLGQRLASHGYVVMMIQPPLRTHFPAERATALQVATQWLTTGSPVADRVDPQNLALYGYSMGGGAVLRAATAMPKFKAVVSAFPWDPSPSFTTNTAPTLVLASKDDTTASLNKYASPIYTSLVNSPERAIAVFPSGGHHIPSSPDGRVSEMTLAWLGRFLAGDARYSRFLCPGPTVGPQYAEYRATCPM